MECGFAGDFGQTLSAAAQSVRPSSWSWTRTRSFAGALLLAATTLVAVAGPLSVSSGGTATYSRPIEVPPGIAGLAPQLGISYAGGSGNGPIGYGWSLQGLSAVTRCAAIPAIDGKRSTVTYGATDKLCLDGMRLIQTDESGNPAASSNASGVAVSSQANDAQGLGTSAYREFRTEKDMYARVRAYGYANGDTSGASGPAYFKVWMKSGQIFEYGASPTADANANALITRTGAANGAMVWALARISDTAGNAIDFKYEQRTPAWGTGPTSGSPTLGREWTILEIQYSGNKVVFNYDGDTRTDRAEAYHQGTKTVSVRRLSSITTYVNSANTGALGPATNAVAVKTVRLDYETGPVSNRSRVSAIRECAGGPASARCLPADTFTYTAGGGDVYTANAGFLGDALALTVLRNTASTAGTIGIVGTIAFDIDGDGKTDLLRWGDNPTNNAVWFSNGDGTFRRATNFSIPVNLMRSDGCYRAYIVDVNGDGLPDIFRFRTLATCSTTDTSSLVFLNNGDGTFTQRPYTGPAIPIGQAQQNGSGTTSGATFYLMDVNGDGKVDLITASTPALTTSSTDACTGCTNVYLGDGTGAFSAVASNVNNVNLYNSDGTAPPVITDLNGDGLRDLILWKQVGGPAQTRIWLSRGDGSFDAGATYLQSSSSPPMISPYKTVIDVNGDSKPEILVSNQLQLAADSQNYQWLSGFSIPSGTPLDLNGDGLEDILVTSDTASQNVVYLSNGDGTVRTSTTFNLGGSSPVQLIKSDGTYNYVVGDFTGRGSVEFLRTAAVPASTDATSNLLLVKSNSTPPDLLQSMRTSLGVTTTLNYTTLGNPLPGSPSASLGSRYTSDRGNSSYAISGAIDVTPPLYVVATSVTDSGVTDSGVGASTISTEYAYTGFKASLTGRGGLGFRQMQVQTVAPNGEMLTTATEYLQSHPYIGAVKGVQTFRRTLNGTASNAPPTYIVNAYCDRSNPVDPGAGYNDCAVTAKVARPYMSKSTHTGYELDNTNVRVLTTVKQFNDYGDVMRDDVTTTGSVAGISQTFLRTTVNTYHAADTSCSAITTCAWVLGRLNRTTTTSTVPNSLESIPRSAGNGANATATAGTGALPPPAPQPMSPAVLNTILSVLLDD